MIAIDTCTEDYCDLLYENDSRGEKGSAGAFILLDRDYKPSRVIADSQALNLSFPPLRLLFFVSASAHAHLYGVSGVTRRREHSTNSSYHGHCWRTAL